MPTADTSIARLALFPLILALALFLGWRGGQPPAVRAADAPGGFSNTRAAALVADIARAPHLAGSDEHTRVRAAIADRLRALGLQVEIQQGTGVRQWARFGNAISVAPVANIIAVLPGRDRSQPAVAAMAHYDSVAFAPGAGDDASGATAVLETARVLSTGPRPNRDVVFLITDSEELGLLGAQLFFDEHPLAKRIGAVVNVEARGSRGLATMFQTSPGNAALVDLWARNAIAPAGNSMTSAIYRMLPNDTDLTVVLGKDKTGINAAFIDGQFDYHSPTDSAANLDPRTLQQLGDFAVTTTRALAFAEALPTRGGDSAYFDIFGLSVVRYPVWLGWGLLALAAVGLATVPMTGLGTSRGAVAVGAARMLLITALAGRACQLAATWIYRDDTIALRERLAEAPAALWMYLALCVATVFVARARAGLWLGSILLLVLVALAAQVFLPGASWLFVWPALMAVLVAHLVARSARAGAVAAAVGGGFALAFASQVVIAGYVGLGSMTPVIVALIVPFATALLGPLLVAWTESGRALLATGIMLVAGVAGAGWLAMSDGFSTRYPRPGDLFHLADDRGRSWWVTTSSPAELPPGKAQRVEIPVWSDFRPWGVPAPQIDAPRPNFGFSSANGAMRLQISTAAAGRRLQLSVRPSVPLTGVRVNGKAVDLAVDKWTSVNMRAAVPANLVIEATAAKPGRIEVRYLAAADGLPPNVPQPNGPPTNWTSLSGSRVVTGTARGDIR